VESLWADSDGVIRFFPPPATWGTRLTVDCNVSAGAKETHQVDLNDATTFFREPELLGAPRIVGVRPPLTGDLGAISANDLAKGGYPPRPDPIAHPEQYANWANDVGKPVNIIWARGLAAIGHHAGTYQGT
jgi:hypothetical protein